MLPILTVIGGLVGAAVTGLVTLYLGRRASSGSATTSDASDLWATLRSELARLQARVTELEGKVAVSGAEISALQTELAAVRLELARACALLDQAHRDADT